MQNLINNLKFCLKGEENGAIVEFLDRKQLNEMMPYAYSPTGRALWSLIHGSKSKEVVNALKMNCKKEV